MAQTTYITKSLEDPEIKNLGNNFVVWPEAPFNGVLIPTAKFKSAVGLMAASHEIEVKGLGVIPEQPSNTFSDILVGSAIGAGAVILFCIVVKCQFAKDGSRAKDGP